MTFADRFDTFHGLPVFTLPEVRTAFGSVGTEVDLSEHRTPQRWRNEEWRYVAVSE